MTQELLIEIGCEDLPARYVLPLAQALTAGITSGLTAKGLGFGDSRTFATPRRIAVSITAVDERQPDQMIERKGPTLSAAFKDGQPTPAALGFARSCGVDLNTLKRENEQLVFRKKQQGQPTARLMPELFEASLKQMDTLVPKRMRWGEGEETFVRPVQWLLALFGSKLIPIQRFGLKAGRKTYGHRFHAPQAIPLKSSGDYEVRLRQAKVWADFSSRRDVIREGIERKARELGGTPRIDGGLLDEVTALVEWPVVIAGRIEERFLSLPPEVVIATVETNQRYFTVFDAAGKLLPAFITIANIESKDATQIVIGNERVVRPRLSDALFFWRKDTENHFKLFEIQLVDVTFQHDLGSLADKVLRIEELSTKIGLALNNPEYAVMARWAASLCKNDLVTKMVYEFPELQGLMGSYYAEKSGGPEAVVVAIREHYQPIQAGTLIPSTVEGRIVALADKLDTLAGIFAIGQKPTASKDPFALRRAALGLLRICIEGDLDLDLRELLAVALEQQPAGQRDDVTLDALWSFVLERLRGYALEQGYMAEQFEAVRAVAVTRPLDFSRRLKALQVFAGSAAAVSLAAADKRARNILKQAQAIDAELVAARLEHPAEKALASAIKQAETDLQPLRRQARYDAMLERLADLKLPVDDFFDAVMVMDEDPVLRNNRLLLLTRLDTLCREVADLSQLPGSAG